MLTTNAAGPPAGPHLERRPTLGYEFPTAGELTQGSYWWRTRAAAQRAQAADALATRLIKVERYLELTHLDGKQAEVDSKEAQAVSQLLEALKDVPVACIRVGSILLVKYVQNGNPVALARSLSQREIRLLEQYPEIQQNPASALAALATALAAASTMQDAPQPQPLQGH